LWANIFGFSSSDQATTKITGSIEDAMPSRNTVLKVANGASLTLAVAAVTTSSAALCAGGVLAIDTAINLAQSAKRGAATNVLTNQAVGVTQEYQDKKEDGK
jgi:hypothetical protein